MGVDRDRVLEWADGGEGPTLALLVHHDDNTKEFAHTNRAESSAETEHHPVGSRLGWTIIVMVRDWEHVLVPVR